MRTGLEPATPCVTGRYSNQAELPHQSFALTAFSPFWDCKDSYSILNRKFFFKKLKVFPVELGHYPGFVNVPVILKLPLREPMIPLYCAKIIIAWIRPPMSNRYRNLMAFALVVSLAVIYNITIIHHLA